MEYVLPEVLENNPHLPITRRMTSKEAIPLVNSFYSTSFSKKDFKETHAYANAEGRLCLDLISEDETINISFLNHSSKATNVLNIKLVNPLKKNGFKLLDAPLELALVEELDFLKDYKTGYTFGNNLDVKDQATLEQLRNLLNNYAYLGPWYVGELHHYSLVGLKILHNGNSDNLPNGLKLPTNQRTVLLELNSGFIKGVICLLVF